MSRGGEKAGNWPAPPSSGKLALIIVAAVFFSELLVMVLLHLFGLQGNIAALAGPVLFVLFLVPIFVYFVCRPINDINDECRDYEKFRQQAYDEMESKVKERTAELVQKNELFYREITERKKAEKELREKNAFLEVIIESLDHPFYVIDAKTYEIKLANSAAGFRGGNPSAKCYELTHNRTTPCSGEDGDPCLLRKVVESGEPQVSFHTHYRPDGTEFEVEIHTQPIFDEQGKVSSLIEFVMEVPKRGR